MSHEVSEQNLVGTSKDGMTPKGWHKVVAILSGAVVGFLIGIFTDYLTTLLICSIEPVECGWTWIVYILLVFPVGPFFGAIGGYLLLGLRYWHDRIGFAVLMIIFSIGGFALFSVASFYLPDLGSSWVDVGVWIWICFPYCGFAIGVPVAMALFQKLRGTANRNISL